MPEYDPVKYPEPFMDDLTMAEAGRDPIGQTQPRHWPSSNVLPDQYDGPPPSREFETAAHNLITGRHAEPPATTDDSSVMPSTSPTPVTH